MANSIFQRLNYYDGMFLTAGLMAIEQNYFSNWLSYQNQATYTAGVLEGLAVQAQANTLVVDYGMGLDSLGHLLVFPEGSGNTFPIPNNVTDTFSVYLSWPASPVSGTVDTVNQQATIVMGTPADPTTSILLAEVSLSAPGVIATVTDKRVSVTSKVAPQLSKGAITLSKALNGSTAISVAAQQAQLTQDIYYLSDQTAHFTTPPLLNITVQTNTSDIFVANVAEVSLEKFTVSLAAFPQASSDAQTVQINWLALPTS